jgi:hypothetical protein
MIVLMLMRSFVRRMPQDLNNLHKARGSSFLPQALSYRALDACLSMARGGLELSAQIYFSGFLPVAFSKPLLAFSASLSRLLSAFSPALPRASQLPTREHRSEITQSNPYHRGSVTIPTVRGSSIRAGPIPTAVRATCSVGGARHPRTPGRSTSKFNR